MTCCHRVVKSKGVSVADATAVWYVSVLTSTATMAMPVAPQLREMILNHTRYVNAFSKVADLHWMHGPPVTGDLNRVVLVNYITDPCIVRSQKHANCRKSNCLFVISHRS